MNERTRNSESGIRKPEAAMAGWLRRTLLSTTTLLWLVAANSFGYSFAGGTGEPGDPYQIATAEQLTSIGSDPNLLTKHFVLVADIDLAPTLLGGKPFDRSPIAPAWGGHEGNWAGGLFTGVFDGNGRRISHLTIRGGQYIGLFGQLASGAEVRDLGVVDVNVVGSSTCGGLVGSSEGIVSRCFSTGSVSGQHYVGGLIGQNDGVVAQSYSTSEALCTKPYAGLVMGGLVGRNYKGRVTQCYSTGAVTGSGSVGGLVGESYLGLVTHCYSTGAVISTGTYIGGLVGTNSGTAIGCFWDTQTSGRTASAGGTGLTTAQMQDIQTYLDAGWDFVDEVGNGTSQVWQMPSQGGYPVLAILSGYTPPQLQGLGTPESPYLIWDALDLGAVTYYSPSACYRLVASIDLGGIRWAVAVVPWFAGVFDGNSLTLSHLTVKGGGNLGLFGDLVSSAQVKDLDLADVNIVGSESSVGGLAGTNLGTVTHCTSTGAVSGMRQDIGGLIGVNWGTLTWCSAAGSVRCTGGARFSSRLGGLVGDNTGDVTWCSAVGLISGCEDVGGLVGSNDGGHLAQCVSTGEVSGSLSIGGLVGPNSGGSPTAIP